MVFEVFGGAAEVHTRGSPAWSAAAPRNGTSELPAKPRGLAKRRIVAGSAVAEVPRVGHDPSVGLVSPAAKQCSRCRASFSEGVTTNAGVVVVARNS